VECWQKGAVNKGLYAADILETGFAISLRSHQFLFIPEKTFVNHVSKIFFFQLSPLGTTFPVVPKLNSEVGCRRNLQCSCGENNCPDSTKTFAVLPPQMEQMFLDPGSTRTTNPLIF